jgi:hypothetical protein
MITQQPGLTVVRYHRRRHDGSTSSNKLLKIALWMVWLPIVAVVWLILLDTSYDWISSPSNIKVVSGLMVLILMACVALALLVKGAKKWWTR